MKNENFKEWIVRKYRLKNGYWKNNRFGDLARDINMDRTFPVIYGASIDRKRALDYLCARKACKEAIAAFKELYPKYRKEVNQ